MEEKVFGDKYKFQYIFKPYKGSKHLLVCLSSCVSPAAEDKHPYQMMNITENIPCNRLYIRDSLGNRGTYYLCYHMDFSVLDTVCDLIRNICNENNIDIKDVITIGSSKGGSAALLVGLTLNCGNIITSVPQIMLGDYISNFDDLKEDMIGNNSITDSVSVLNEFIFKLLEKSSTKIHMLTTNYDTNFKSNMSRFITVLKTSNTNHYIEYNDNIKNPIEVCNYNTDFFVIRILNIIFSIDIKKNNNEMQLFAANEKCRLKIQHFNKNTQDIILKNNTIISLKDVSNIEIEIVVKEKIIFSWIIYKWFADLITPEYLINDNKLIVILNSQEDSSLIKELKYCVYLEINNKTVVKTDYQSENIFIFDYEPLNTYNCIYYIYYNGIRKSYKKFNINFLERKITTAEKFKLCKFDFNIRDSKLMFLLKPQIQFEQNSLFCFYVLKNKNPLYKGQYSKNNFLEFNINEEGNYSIVYYVLENGERFSKQSNVINYKNFKTTNISIDIFGSCVSRDILEYNKPNGFILGKYIARQSIFSAVSKSYEVNEGDITLESAFQKRMVISDLNKTAFDNLKSTNSKYLIIDLIDERFMLYSLENEYFTASNELCKVFPSGIKGSILKKKTILNNEVYIGCRNVTNLIDRFCDKMCSIYNPGNIIIHYALMVDQYIDKNGEHKKFEKNYLNQNKNINNILIHMYERIIHQIPDAKVIKMPNNTYADENNKWGLSPMHYSPEYYHYILNEVCKYINSIEEGKDI